MLLFLNTRFQHVTSCVQVLGFASRGAAEDYMLKHPETTLGAVHFDVDSSAGLPFGSSKAINYVIQSNNTVRPYTFLVSHLANYMPEMGRAQLVISPQHSCS